MCRQACSEPADCVLFPGGPVTYDADNWACVSGSCRYLGCRGDECAAVRDESECALRSDSRVPTCHHRCTSREDCTIPTAPRLFDADNWSCDEGLCVHLSCVDDSECETLYRGSTCDVAPPLGPSDTDTVRRQCVPSCTVAADCRAFSPLPVEELECVEGRCHYRACTVGEACYLPERAGVCFTGADP